MAYIGKVIVPSNKLLAQMNLQRRTGGICWEGHCALKQAHWPSKRYDGVVLLLIRPCAHQLQMIATINKALFPRSFLS